mgnify:FL=1
MSCPDLGTMFCISRRDRMRILQGRYLVGGTEKVVHLSEMNKQKYQKRFKGKLYCPTEGCLALLSYSAGKKAHFKTWRLRHHSTDCIYNRERAIVQSSHKEAEATISGNRRQNALRQAAKMFEGSKFEKESKAQQNIAPRLSKRQRKNNIQLTLYDDLLKDDALVKRGAIRKKFVDELTLKDVGQVRLVLGYIDSMELVNSVAELVIQYNNKQVKVVYPEAFIKERLNRSYLNKFGVIFKALESEQPPTFMGIGEIQYTDKQAMELIIYNGTDFRINNMDLSLFAKQYANG